ncbi:MAG: hypothetical protein FJY83_01255 [Candidatus Aminicenantes bacterium]|nr:hypothetical protein [Candidatus Aminicenantes bacterium]
MSDLIVLVQPNCRVPHDESSGAVSPPLGLLHIGAVLEKHRIPVEVIDAHGENLGAGRKSDPGNRQAAGCRVPGFLSS